MHQLTAPPAIDALERRLLLSSITIPIGADLPAQTGVVALKKDGGGDKGKGHGKAKKSPEITVLFNNGSLTNGDGTVDFGQVTVGDAAPTRTFVIRNEGKGSLAIGSIVLPAGFSLVDAPAGRIGRRDATSFTGRLDSSVAGAHLGQLRVSNNDADEGVFSIAFSGRGAPQGAPPPPP